MRNLLMVMLLMASAAMPVQASDDEPVRWALDAQIGAGYSVFRHNDLEGPGYFVGPLHTRSGFISILRAEFYLPETHFSLKGGYEHERLNMLSGDAETAFSELMVGGRWYPAPWNWQVQPFVGLDGFVSLGALNDRSQMSSSEGYERNVLIRNPRVSVAPVVGMDIYLLSHVALQVEYGFRLGIDSRMTATSTYSRMPGQSFVTETNLHRHALTFGIKLTFPFLFTYYDGETLFEGLLNTIFGTD